MRSREDVAPEKRPDWLVLLEESFLAGTEECHAGCGDKAAVLSDRGKHVGAFCKGCWSEIRYGRIEPLHRRRA